MAYEELFVRFMESKGYEELLALFIGGEGVDETTFYFDDDEKEVEHYIGYLPQYENLSVSTYVEQEDTREKIDIKVLNKEIVEIVAREQVLKDEIENIIAEIEGGGDFE